MDEEEVRVVVVDDDPDLCEAVQQLLELDGYTVRTATDGESAMTVIADHDPHCVIFDLDMPGLSGFELAQRIRATVGSGIVLIVLTASMQPGDQLDAEQAGADFVLHKPLDVERLRRMLPPLV